jgi:hypothetical protein
MQEPQLIRDLIVVLPGIMGSTLVKDGTLVWGPSAGSVLRAIGTFGKCINELTLPNCIGDERPDDKVKPAALMPDLHLLPGIWSVNIGYGKLLDWLQTRFHLIAPGDPARIPSLIPVPYDWRLSNRYNGKRLKSIVEPALERWRSQGEPFSDAKIIFICHSMGGLVARWYIEKEGGAANTRKLVTLGTPYRGALDGLDKLVNGIRKGIGPIKVELTDFARSMPSLHQLLPEYACIEAIGGQLKNLSETSVPQLDPDMVSDAMKFHDELDQSASSRTTDLFDIHPILGSQQPTYATARIVDNSVEPIDTIGGNDEGGDGTVPRFASIPKGLRPDSPSLHFIADQHGALQSNRAVFDQLEGVLTSQPAIYRAASQYQLGVRTEPLVLAGEEINVEARIAGGERVGLVVRVNNERGQEAAAALLKLSGGVYRAALDPLPPGAYKLVVAGVDPGSDLVAPVTSAVLVWA